MRTSRRLALLVLTAALPLSVVTPAVAAPAPRSDRPTPPPWLKIENGVSVPQFDLANAVEETLFVQTEVDSDLDGVKDRVRVRLSRPGETETQGIKVPVVFEHSPYRYNTGGGVNHNVDFSVLPQEGVQRSAADAGGTAAAPRADLPGSLDNYWVPRGYAVVLGESIGTGFSDGCPTVGDMKETLGTKAVIDWLNGRAKAYDEAGAPVAADWTTGDVGMTGVSYNGTLPNQVATTGVEGLRTIVPVSAIASWYDYYRANGLVRAPHSNTSGRGENAFQGEDLDVLGYYVEGPGRVEKCAHITDALLQYADRTTGDYNAYWHERDYLHRARSVKASVFVVHGLEDYNVMPTAYSSWWSQLERYDVPRKIWLHKGGHGGPGSASDYQRTLNRWMDYWLFGVRNGVMSEPRADVQRPDGTYEKYADWPAPGARDTKLRLSSADATTPGGLGRSGGGPRQSFVDSGRTLDTDVSLLPNPDAANPNRLAYLSAPLARDTHLSGTPSVSLRASVDNRYAANLTAVLVDYGPDGQTMVTRGWTDVQNRKDVDRGTPVEQGREYTFEWPLESDDYVFPAGHRIGLVIVSTDMHFTLRPLPGTQLTVNPGKSAVTLPVVGGRL
jgi:X-Pro dipeptidyl-peptidase